jgi:hypothetical protein
MKPKQKAIELIDKYQFLLTEKHFAKKCALISIDEIIEATKVSTYNGKENSIGWNFDLYWNQVKDEIEKL